MKKNIVLIFFIVIVISITCFTEKISAQEWIPINKNDNSNNESIFKLYKNYADVPAQNIIVPKIIEVYFNVNDINDSLASVFDVTNNKFISPALVMSEANKVMPNKAIDTQTGNSVLKLFDSNLSTLENFYLINQYSGYKTIEIEFSKEIKSDSIEFILGNYVTLPDSVTVRAEVNGTYIIVLNKSQSNANKINFPETVSKKWQIELSYSQMLSIYEIKLNNLLDTTSKKSLRFIAEPNRQYKIYLNSESSVYNNAQDYNYQNLYVYDTLNVKNIGFINTFVNPDFVPADYDKDGVLDSKDNCYYTANPKQLDVDSNGVGDECDDYDRDLVINLNDNCPNVANYDQKDTDGDKIGDKCDSDESRITEKYPWIVWSLLGFSFVIFVALLYIASKKIRDNNIPENPNLP